jgi:hypothetical protein
MVFKNIQCILFLVLAGILSVASAAVMDTINGVVSDSATKSPINSVTVASEGVSTTTNISGIFTLVLPPTNVVQFRQSRNEDVLVWHAENSTFSWSGYLGKVLIRVRDVQGSLVADFLSEKNSDKSCFSMANLPQGMYIVTIGTPGRMSAYKIFNLGTTRVNSFLVKPRNVSTNSAGLSKAIEAASSHILTFTKSGYATTTVTVPAGSQNNITVSMSATTSQLVRIFDGKTLTGWVPVATNNWQVNTQDSAIQCTGAGRGYIYTTGKYLHYRVIFTIRSNNSGGHNPCILIFGQNVNADALAAYQFQLPSTWTWDYRPGANNEGLQYVTKYNDPVTNYANWTQCEVLVNTAAGWAMAAVAQPPGTKATKVISFNDASVKTYGAAPFGIQAHNAGVSDEYKDIFIENNPSVDSLITTR